MVQKILYVVVLLAVICLAGPAILADDGGLELFVSREGAWAGPMGAGLYFEGASVTLKASLVAHRNLGGRVELPGEWQNRIVWELSEGGGEYAVRAATVERCGFYVDTLRQGGGPASRQLDLLLPGDAIECIVNLGPLHAGGYRARASLGIEERTLVSLMPAGFLVERRTEQGKSSKRALMDSLLSARTHEDVVHAGKALAQSDPANPWPHEVMGASALRNDHLAEARAHYASALAAVRSNYNRIPPTTQEEITRAELRIRQLSTVSKVFEFAEQRRERKLEAWTDYWGRETFIWIDRRTGRAIGIVDPDDPAALRPLPVIGGSDRK